MPSTRRRFLKTGATLAAGGAAIGGRLAWGFPSPAAVVPPLSTFKYSEVQLLEGLLREQFDHNHNLFLHLDEDALDIHELA